MQGTNQINGFFQGSHAPHSFGGGGSQQYPQQQGGAYFPHQQQLGGGGVGFAVVAPSSQQQQYLQPMGSYQQHQPHGSPAASGSGASAMGGHHALADMSQGGLGQPHEGGAEGLLESSARSFDSDLGRPSGGAHEGSGSNPNPSAFSNGGHSGSSAAIGGFDLLLRPSPPTVSSSMPTQPLGSGVGAAGHAVQQSSGVGTAATSGSGGGGGGAFYRSEQDAVYRPPATAGSIGGSAMMGGSLGAMGTSPTTTLGHPPPLHPSSLGHSFSHQQHQQPQQPQHQQQQQQQGPSSFGHHPQSFGSAHGGGGGTDHIVGGHRPSSQNALGGLGHPRSLNALLGGGDGAAPSSLAAMGSATLLNHSLTPTNQMQHFSSSAAAGGGGSSLLLASGGGAPHQQLQQHQLAGFPPFASYPQQQQQFQQQLAALQQRAVSGSGAAPTPLGLFGTSSLGSTSNAALTSAAATTDASAAQFTLLQQQQQQQQQMASSVYPPIQQQQQGQGQGQGQGQAAVTIIPVGGGGGGGGGGSGGEGSTSGSGGGVFGGSSAALGSSASAFFAQSPHRQGSGGGARGPLGSGSHTSFAAPMAAASLHPASFGAAGVVANTNVGGFVVGGIAAGHFSDVSLSPPVSVSTGNTNTAGSSGGALGGAGGAGSGLPYGTANATNTSGGGGDQSNSSQSAVAMALAAAAAGMTATTTSGTTANMGGGCSGSSNSTSNAALLQFQQQQHQLMGSIGGGSGSGAASASPIVMMGANEMAQLQFQQQHNANSGGAPHSYTSSYQPLQGSLGALPPNNNGNGGLSLAGANANFAFGGQGHASQGQQQAMIGQQPTSMRSALPSGSGVAAVGDSFQHQQQQHHPNNAVAALLMGAGESYNNNSINTNHSPLAAGGPSLSHASVAAGSYGHSYGGQQPSNQLAAHNNGTNGANNGNGGSNTNLLNAYSMQAQVSPSSTFVVSSSYYGAGPTSQGANGHPTPLLRQSAPTAGPPPPFGHPHSHQQTMPAQQQQMLNGGLRAGSGRGAAPVPSSFQQPSSYGMASSLGHTPGQLQQGHRTVGMGATPSSLHAAPQGQQQQLFPQQPVQGGMPPMHPQQQQHPPPPPQYGAFPPQPSADSHQQLPIGLVPLAGVQPSATAGLSLAGSSTVPAAASASPSASASASAAPPAANKDNLYVSGLPMECRDGDLNGLFESAIAMLWPSEATRAANVVTASEPNADATASPYPLGPPTANPPRVLSGSVRMNINTGVSRGFGFVKMSAEAAAQCLLACLDGAIVAMVDATVTVTDAASGAIVSGPHQRRVLRVVRRPTVPPTPSPSAGGASASASQSAAASPLGASASASAADAAAGPLLLIDLVRPVFRVASVCPESGRSLITETRLLQLEGGRGGGASVGSAPISPTTATAVGSATGSPTSASAGPLSPTSPNASSPQGAPTPFATSRLHIVFAQTVADYNPAALMPKVFARNFPATVSFAAAEALFARHEGFVSMIYQKGGDSNKDSSNGNNSNANGGLLTHAADAAAVAAAAEGGVANNTSPIVIEPRHIGLFGSYNAYVTYATVENAVAAAHGLHNTKGSLPADQSLAALALKLQQLLPALATAAAQQQQQQQQQMLLTGPTARHPSSSAQSPSHPLFLTRCVEAAARRFAALISDSAIVAEMREDAALQRRRKGRVGAASEEGEVVDVVGGNAPPSLEALPPRSTLTELYEEERAAANAAVPSESDSSALPAVARRAIVAYLVRCFGISLAAAAEAQPMLTSPNVNTNQNTAAKISQYIANAAAAAMSAIAAANAAAEGGGKTGDAAAATATAGVQSPPPAPTAADVLPPALTELRSATLFDTSPSKLFSLFLLTSSASIPLECVYVALGGGAACPLPAVPSPSLATGSSPLAPPPTPASALEAAGAEAGANALRLFISRRGADEQSQQQQAAAAAVNSNTNGATPSPPPAISAASLPPFLLNPILSLVAFPSSVVAAFWDATLICPPSHDSGTTASNANAEETAAKKCGEASRLLSPSQQAAALTPSLDPIPILAKVAEDIEFRKRRLEAKSARGGGGGPNVGGRGRGGGAGGRGGGGGPNYGAHAPPPQFGGVGRGGGGYGPPQQQPYGGHQQQQQGGGYAQHQPNGGPYGGGGYGQQQQQFGQYVGGGGQPQQNAYGGGGAGYARQPPPPFGGGAYGGQQQQNGYGSAGMYNGGQQQHQQMAPMGNGYGGYGQQLQQQPQHRGNPPQFY